MRNWGIVVTVFYAVVVFLLLSYGASFLADGLGAVEAWVSTGADEFLALLILVAFLVLAQALLLFLSVDTSWRRLKPQRHTRVTAGLVGLMVAILLISAVLAIASRAGRERVVKSWRSA